MLSITTEETFLRRKTIKLHFEGGGSDPSQERFKDSDVDGREETLHKLRWNSAIGLETNGIMQLAPRPIAEDGLADRRRPRWGKRGSEVY